MLSFLQFQVQEFFLVPGKCSKSLRKKISTNGWSKIKDIVSINLVTKFSFEKISQKRIGDTYTCSAGEVVTKIQIRLSSYGNNKQIEQKFCVIIHSTADGDQEADKAFQFVIR